MARLLGIASAGVCVIQFGACAQYQHYQPAPLASATEASAYGARRLDDPALAHILAAHGIPVRDSAWDSRQLALAALYFRPDLSEAQRALAATRAAEITAGVRPYPGVSASAERAARADEGHLTPWTFSLTTGFTFELGGKRAARVTRARVATLAARLRLESTAWQVIESARQTGIVAFGADVDLADAGAMAAALRTALGLLRDRYSEGQISRADLARSETDVQTAAVAAMQAAGARTDARSALARALAVSVRQVDQLPLRPALRAGCVTVDSLSLDTLETYALRTLPAVGAALADYAVAEADLRVQVAQQYPDVILGPGIAWGQGTRRWILSLGFPRIAIDRARGPIAEAAARRAVQAARVKVVQDAVLAAVDSGVASCWHVRREVEVADSLVRASGEQVALAQAAYQRGEIGRTELALTQLALVRAQRAQHQATQRTRAAGIALENATGMWLSGPPIEWRDIVIAPDEGVRSDRASSGGPPQHRK